MALGRSDCTALQKNCQSAGLAARHHEELAALPVAALREAPAQAPEVPRHLVIRQGRDRPLQTALPSAPQSVLTPIYATKYSCESS